MCYSMFRPPWLRRALTALCLVALLSSCAFNFAVAPRIMCLLDGECAGSKAVYPRTVAATCSVSYVALFVRHRSLSAVRARNVSAHAAYTATTAAERRRVVLFRTLAVLVCLSTTASVHAARLWLLYAGGASRLILVYFVLMYTQNLCMCATEIHFVSLCYSLHGMLSKANRDLKRIGEEVAAAVGQTTTTARPDVYRRVTYRKDFYASPSGEHSIANTIEVIRIRHRLIRDAIYALVDLFGLPMGMSLFALCVMALFDIYYQVFQDMGASSRTPIFLYMWLLQYSIRFYSIVVTAHKTSKQANKSKILITDINNRYLDDSTKEELQFFLNQISSCTNEFTACDFFTLNTHLITSTIAAGTTYLVILLQFNSSPAEELTTSTITDNINV